MNELERSNGVAMGTCGRLLIVHYESSPTMEGTRALERATSRDASLRTARLAVMVVIDGGVRPPEPAVRAAVQNLMRRFEQNTLGIAYVIRAEGFHGAAARAVVSGMILFNRPKFQVKVFARVSDAVVWLDSKENPTMSSDSSERVQEIERFCASTPCPGA